jgi:hypothetical protein
VVVAIGVLPVLGPTCTGSEADDLKAQVRRLRAANEELQAALSNEQADVAELTDEVEATEAELDRVGDCLNLTALAGLGLALSVNALAHPEVLSFGGGEFTPGGRRAHAPDGGLMRSFDRNLTKAERYLADVAWQRFSEYCFITGHGGTRRRPVPPYVAQGSPGGFDHSLPQRHMTGAGT